MKLVVSHDAGSAFILKSFFKNKDPNLHYLLSGPAKKIFNLPNYFTTEKKINLSIYKKIFFGTSLNSKFEIKILNKVKNKIKTIVFFDSWLNLHNRLLLNRRLVLPDEIWVFDKLAENLAKKCFKNKVKIKLKKNYYLDYLKKKNHKKKTTNKKQSILYLVGLIFKTKNNPYYKTEYKALIKFLSVFNKKNFDYNLIIRVHPNDNINEFIKIIDTKLLSSNSLEEDLLNSSIVIGANSMALYYSSFIKNKTFCMIPKKERIYKPLLKLKKFNINNLK